MPFILAATNVQLKKETHEKLLAKLSQTAAEVTGKPEQYVMASLNGGAMMMFAGSDKPCAYVEFKSIGLPDSQLKSVAEKVCSLLREELSIDPERIYLEMTSVDRKCWGWNGSTF